MIIQPQQEETESQWGHPQLQNYLNVFFEQDQVFRDLREVKSKGWNNVEADKVFDERRKIADTAGKRVRAGFFSMMKKIAAQIDERSRIFALPQGGRLLDLCMAPGGFVQYALTDRPDLSADCVSLPTSEGGHEVLAKPLHRDGRLVVYFSDLTMMSSELSDVAIPDGHPEAEKLKATWPYEGDYDLVICDGQNLRTQVLLPYRENIEQARLFYAQMIVGLKRARPGGSFLVLLHRVDRWRTFSIVRQFSQFSGVALFKPQPFHAIKSSLYLIAQNFRRNAEAQSALQDYQRLWTMHTLSSLVEHDSLGDVAVATKEQCDEFLEEYARKARPVFQTQLKALSAAAWTRS